MAFERTFSIIKPDATKRNLTGAINAMIEGAGARFLTYSVPTANSNPKVTPWSSSTGNTNHADGIRCSPE